MAFVNNEVKHWKTDMAVIFFFLFFRQIECEWYQERGQDGNCNIRWPSLLWKLKRLGEWVPITSFLACENRVNSFSEGYKSLASEPTHFSLIIWICRTIERERESSLWVFFLIDSCEGRVKKKRGKRENGEKVRGYPWRRRGKSSV